VVLVEHQTNWEMDLPLRLLEYRARYSRKYRLPVDTLVFLVLPHRHAYNTYADPEVLFTFRLVRLWELEAADFLEEDIRYLPLIPLMKNDLRFVEEIERRIVVDVKDRNEQAGLLAALGHPCPSQPWNVLFPDRFGVLYRDVR